MTRRDNASFNWDELLNGEPHTVDLSGYYSGINDFRARAYREADKRKRVIKTHKVDAITLEIQALYGAGLHGCSCGAPPGRRHMPACELVASAAAQLQREQDQAQDEAMRQLAQQDQDPQGLAA